MEQLLRITTIPLEYEMKVHNSRLEYTSSKSRLEMDTKQGGLTIRSRRAKLNLDSFEARNSVLPSVKTMVYQTAEKGIQAAQDASAQAAQEGQQLLKAKNGEDVLGQIFQQRTELPTGEFQLGFIPTAPVDIKYQPGDLKLNYEMDRLNFELRAAQGKFEYIPGSVEISITQQPDVLIEYIGPMLYVPPSASPDYEPIDVMA